MHVLINTLGPECYISGKYLKTQFSMSLIALNCLLVYWQRSSARLIPITFWGVLSLLLGIITEISEDVAFNVYPFEICWLP